MTAKVNLFKAHVKYTGKFSDYSKDDLAYLAQNEALKHDCFWKEIDMPNEEAEALNGQVYTFNLNSENHVALVTWASIKREV